MSSSCGNSSNLLGNMNVKSITHSGARLMMTHPLGGFSGGFVSSHRGDDGITAGDAIRWEADENAQGSGKYTKARADRASTSEVVGIVESIEGVNADGSAGPTSLVNVVISGQIKYDIDKLVSATHIDSGTTGSAGGNDVYFLSEVTGGALQNLAPSTPTFIAKPVLQRAVDGDFTAQVVNYIGYQIGGEIVGTRGRGEPKNGVADILDFGGPKNPMFSGDWWDLSKVNWLSINNSDIGYRTGDPTYYTSYTIFGNANFGTRWKVTFKETPKKSDEYLNITTKLANGKVDFSGKVQSINIVTKEAYITTTTTSNLSADQKMFGRSGQYTIATADKIAFALPRVQGTVVNNFVDINGSKRNGRQVKAMFVNRDSSPSSVEDTRVGRTPGEAGTVVSIPDNVEVQEITIRDNFTVQSETHNVKITDLADTIKRMNTDIQACLSKLNISETAGKNITNKT